LGPKGLTHPTFIPSNKFRSISIDWTSGFKPHSPSGKNAVMHITCRYSTRVRFIPVSTTATAAQCAQLLIDHWVRDFGLPSSIFSDRDPRITSYLWETVCALLGIHSMVTTAYHQAANGQAERTGQTMEQLLRIQQLRQVKWWEALPIVEMQMNAAPTIGEYSPYFISYGFDPTTVADVMLQTQVPNPSASAQEWVAKIMDVHQHVRHLLAQRQKLMRHKADKHRRLCTSQSVIGS
jgi:hypothetical protein